jgi:hypothetical protein
MRWQTLVSDLRRLVEPHRDQAVAHPTPEPVAKASPPTASAAHAAVRNGTGGKAPTPTRDELMASLERLGKARETELAKPTPAEVEQAEFFKRSDEFRETEGDQVHCLRRLDGEDEETSFVVTPSGLKVGRKAPADIIVPGAGVSREHCLIELAADQLRVTDLNSTNGTYIDNKRIDRSEVLAVGSVLRVGNVSFEHEVRTRGEMQKHQAANFDWDRRPPEGRVAGRS